MYALWQGSARGGMRQIEQDLCSDADYYAMGYRDCDRDSDACEWDSFTI